MGLEYQMAALQAVMAQQLGIQWQSTSGADSAATSKRQSKVAERVMQWRWMIIDEIRMVSAKVLAEIDVKLRDIGWKCHIMKTGVEGLDRPFG